MKVLKKLISPPMVAAIVAVIIMSIVLIFSPVIGMADNGDFYRVMNGNGLYKLDRGESDEYLDYFSSQHGVYQYYLESEASLVSSHNVFILAAKSLNSIFAQDNRFFDMRYLSMLSILYCAAAIYLIVDFAAYKVRGAARYVIAALAVLFFADTGYTAYFNSFYAEGLVMVSFLTCTASLLLISQKRYKPYWLLGVFFVNALILVFSKQQNAPVGVLLALLLGVMAWMLKYDGAYGGIGVDPPKTQYIKNRRLFLKMMGSCAALLTVAGIAMYLLIPQVFVNINQYHAMTRGVLMTAENPEDALDSFGINRQYALLNKSIYYERYPAVDVESDTLQTSFYSQYGTVSVLGYYLSHPGQLISMTDTAMWSAYSIRPAAMGNYERSVGRPPGEKTQFFTFYSTLKEQYAPRTFGFILIWTLLIVFANFRNKTRAAILLFCMLNGFLQILVSVVGAGDADLSKHVFLYNVCFDLTLYVGLSSTTVAVSKRAREWLHNRRVRNNTLPRHAEKEFF